MRRLNRLHLILATAIATVSIAYAVTGGLSLHEGSKLWLEGKSTIHDYHANSTSLSATFGCDAAKWPVGSDAGAVDQFVRAKGVTALDVVVPVKGLRSGKSGLDKNMYKALMAEKHPEIRFRMTGYEVADGTEPGAIAIDVKGVLSIAGVEREIRIPVAAQREGDGLRMRGSAPVKMSQFGIKPPTMMMGTVRTADEVVVRFDLLVGAKDAAGAAQAG